MKTIKYRRPERRQLRKKLNDLTDPYLLDVAETVDNFELSTALPFSARIGRRGVDRIRDRLEAQS